MNPSVGSNGRVGSISSDGGRRSYLQEEDSCSLPVLEERNDNQNGGPHSREDSIDDSDRSDSSLDRILNKVSTTLGLEVPHIDYRPMRKHAAPQSPSLNGPIQRSNSALPASDPIPSNPSHVALRRRSIRRRGSDVGLRGPINGKRTSNAKGRDSFELKQNALYSMQTDGTLEEISAMERLQVEEQWNNQQNFWRRLAIRASPPDTSHKELIRRSTFLVISSMTVGAGVLWGLMYVALREWTAALMPWIYSISMGVTLFTCICKSHGNGYETFATCQLTLILVLPFAVHVALGGVERSGGVMLWSFLCPMGAAFFRNADESLRWFWLYLGISGLLLVEGFWHVDNVVHVSVEGEIRSVDSVSSSSSSGTVQKLYWLMNILGVKCVIFAAVFLFARELEREYSKSEEVLANILPKSIVKRIKRGEFPIVDHVAGVTILFADLVGFTKASTELHPNFLIGLFLRDIFHEFDELVYKHGLEKIKTIGDAYMLVGGLNHGDEPSEQSRRQARRYPDQKPHATNIMLMAAEMSIALDRVNKKYNLSFDLRIGVHTGPVVAGVLGLKRFTYDVWGDAVNTASRMESNGVPGLVHLSADMHRSVEGMADTFDFECCGKIQIKGKGEMTTFLARPRGGLRRG